MEKQPEPIEDKKERERKGGRKEERKERRKGRKEEIKKRRRKRKVAKDTTGSVQLLSHVRLFATP